MENNMAYGWGNFLIHGEGFLELGQQIKYFLS